MGRRESGGDRGTSRAAREGFPGQAPVTRIQVRHPGVKEAAHVPHLEHLLSPPGACEGQERVDPAWSPSLPSAVHVQCHPQAMFQSTRQGRT